MGWELARLCVGFSVVGVLLEFFSFHLIVGWVVYSE